MVKIKTTMKLTLMVKKIVVETLHKKLAKNVVSNVPTSSLKHFIQIQNHYEIDLISEIKRG